MKSISGTGIFLRFLFALVLVLATYNPSGYSYFHWFRDAMADFSPILGLAGVALIIGWVIFVRATLRSLGPIGLTLAGLFFGFLVWLLVDLNLLTLDDVSAVTWIASILLAAILGIGISWSHIRRRLSGQVDIDDVDEES